MSPGGVNSGSEACRIPGGLAQRTSIQGSLGVDQAGLLSLQEPKRPQKPVTSLAPTAGSESGRVKGLWSQHVADGCQSVQVEALETHRPESVFLDTTGDPCLRFPNGLTNAQI